MSGKQYTNGFVFSDLNNVSWGWALFNLEGKYKSLSFKVGHIDGSASIDGILYVYLDRELAYTKDLKYDNVAQTVNIPLNNAKQMRLEVYSNAWPYRPSYGFAEGVFEVDTTVSPADTPITENWLETCKAYQYQKGKEYWLEDNKYFNMSGKQYSNGFVFSDLNNVSWGWALFNLEKKYKSVSFKVGHVDGSAAIDGLLNVYLDNELTYTKDLHYDDVAQTIKIPLNGAEQMKIEVYSDAWPYRPSYGFAEGVFELKSIAPPSFAVKGVFGGRDVTLNCTVPGATIYYTTANRSALYTTDPHVKPGTTISFAAYYGTLYARAYYNGQWSNVARLILKIPKVNDPTITKLSNGRTKITTTTPGTIVYYTTNGTEPSATNKAGQFWCSHDINIPAGRIVKAIAVRNCFSDSLIVTQQI